MPPRRGTKMQAPRDLIFVHGVQWDHNKDIEGYSEPLQKEMMKQAPSFDFAFHEVLWSDVVEGVEDDIWSGASLIVDVLDQNYAGAVFDLFQLIGQRSETLQKDQGFQLKNPAEAFSIPLPDLIAGKGGFMKKAASAVLDVVLYFSTHGQAIRDKVRETLDQARQDPPPIVFGHSLGSVILLDIIRENIARSGDIGVGGFISAGSPIGLFQANRDDAAFARLKWINYYDLDDLVTFWNPLHDKGYQSVRDRRIDTHELLFYSHTKYWDSSELSSELADRCLTI